MILAETVICKISEMSSNIRVVRICKFCSNEFIARTSVTKFCGDRCAKRAYKQGRRQEKLSKSELLPKERIVNRVNKYDNSLNYKEFLNVEEAGIILGASRATIFRLMKAGEIKRVKLRGRTIIFRSEIDRLLGI